MKYKLENKKDEVISMYESGKTYKELGLYFKVSNVTIMRNCKRWKINLRKKGWHLPERQKNKVIRNKISATRIKKFEEGTLNLSGKHNPAYIDGTYMGGCRYTGGWERKRNEALKRDNNECKLCFANDVRLDVHHIIPYRVCKEHNLDNLITLCIFCHANLHAGKIQLCDKKMIRVSI